MHTKTQARPLGALLMVASLLTASPALAAGDGHGFPLPHFIATVINFLIFLAIIYKFAWTKIQDFFKTRQAQLRHSLDEAKRLREQAEATLAQYRERLDALEDERQQLLDEYHKQGQREKERIVEDAKLQVEKMRADAKLLIEQETKKAIASIEEKAVDQALGLAATLLKDRLSAPGAQVSLVDSYIAALPQTQRVQRR